MTTAGITVNLSGNSGRWRLRGENSNAWNDPGTTTSGLTPGIYALEFEPLAGHDAPLARQVQLVGGQTLTVEETYLTEAPFGNAAPEPLTLAQATTEAPFQWNGQVHTILGSASGVVVRPLPLARRK